jgi:hypothetical protein
LIIEFQMQLHETGRPGLAGTQVMYAMHPSTAQQRAIILACSSSGN